MKAVPQAKLDLARLAETLNQAAVQLARDIEQQEEELARLAATPLASEDDQAAKLPEQAKAEEILARFKQTQQQVHAAQHRLKMGTYGICEDCHTPIPVERMEALPYATHCVNCQSQHEKARAPLGGRANGGLSRRF